MRKKKRMPVSFIFVFLAAFAAAGAVVLFAPVPEGAGGLVFFGLVCLLSLAGVWALSVLKRGRR